MAGIKASPPSKPKRFVPEYLTWQNFSKPSASTILFNIALRPSAEKKCSLSQLSIRSFNQAASSGLDKCIY